MLNNSKKKKNENDQKLVGEIDGGRERIVPSRWTSVIQNLEKNGMCLERWKTGRQSRERRMGTITSLERITWAQVFKGE